MLTNLVTGPQALAGRVSSRLRPIFRFFLRDRFEHRIAIKEVENFGPTLHLRGRAADYSVGQSERWIADHILRWIPGSGHFPIILPECEALAASKRRCRAEQELPFVLPDCEAVAATKWRWQDG